MPKCFPSWRASHLPRHALPKLFCVFIVILICGIFNSEGFQQSANFKNGIQTTRRKHDSFSHRPHKNRLIKTTSDNSTIVSTNSSTLVEPTTNTYQIHPTKEFLLSLFPSSLVEFNQKAVAPAFTSTLLELFDAIIPRIALYNFANNSIGLRFVDKGYPSEIIVDTSSASNDTTFSELKFAYMNDYAAYWQGVLSIGVLTAIVGMILCSTVFLLLLISLVYVVVWCLFGSRLTRDTIVFKTDPLRWLRMRNRSLRVRLCTRIYLMCHSCTLFLVLLVWAFFSLQSIPASSISMAQYHSHSKDMNQRVDNLLQNSVSELRNATNFIESRLLDVNTSLIATLPNSTTISTYKACPITLVDNLPSANVLKLFVANVSTTLDALPNLGIIQNKADSINALVAQALSQIGTLSTSINDLLSVLLSLLPYFDTLQGELDLYASETEAFPSVTELSAIITGLSGFEDIFTNDFNAAFITLFEDTMNSNTYSTGLYNAAVIFEKLDRVMQAILDAQVELMIQSAAKLKATKASLHSDTVLRATSDQLQVELQKANFTPIMSQIQDVGTTLQQLETEMNNLESFVSQVNATLTSLPSFDVMTVEIAKIADALNQSTCLNTIIGQMEYVNQTLLRLPQNMREMLDLYGVVKEIILKIDMPGKIQSVLEPILFSSNNDIPLVYSELEKFNFNAIKESFPSVDEIESNADLVYQNFSKSLLSFNMDDFQTQLSAFNSSISLIPDLSTFAASFSEINQTLYNARVVNSGGSTGPPISLSTVVAVFFDEQPTAADNGPCDSVCGERVRDSPISGGDDTGPTRNMIILGFWNAACNPALPHVWCWFKNAVLARPNTTELIAQMSIAKNSIANIPDWNILVSKTSALNSSISGLTTLQGTLAELSVTTAELSVRNPNFTVFKTSVNSFSETVANVDFGVVNQAVSDATETYSIISDNSPLDTITNVSDIISTQLNYSSFVALYTAFGDTLQKRNNEMQQLGNEIQESSGNFFNAFDVYDIARIIALLVFAVALLISPCCTNICCVSLCGMRRKCRFLICAKPCNVLCVAMFLAICGIFSWIVVCLGLPLSIILKDACPHAEQAVWATFNAFLPFTNHSNTLRNISSSDLQINELLAATNIPTNVKANFSFSLEDVFYSFTRDSCVGDTSIPLREELQMVAGNLSAVVDDYVYALPLPDSVSILDSMISTTQPIHSDVSAYMQLAVGNIFSLFECSSVNGVYEEMKTSICTDFYQSVSFFWGMFFIVGAITTFGAIGYALSYCLLVNTTVREDYSQLADEDERFNHVVDAIEEYNIQRVLPENLNQLFKEEEAAIAMHKATRRKKRSAKTQATKVETPTGAHPNDSAVAQRNQFMQNTFVEQPSEDSIVSESEFTERPPSSSTKV
uniref:Uncharacterized protein n=1 Tax=Percolomonas cosmopolitus TaxID=63605 RepID=A0A7S1PH80_9EUKA|eukprot:CAMPEP_0117436104 /NCGR_PEP_ID=MMETSP0759-20121206/835_1 /TAXON_ID=63605 /ORGANISM="Percolomonas cosmopolitus, Strain WS" /LENGTH=1387 /DNA_ID=CAMNT_0005227693 /DNA_START=45 /DNA_END=4208 /DNA_ORIENTATION=+